MSKRGSGGNQERRQGDADAGSALADQPPVWPQLGRVITGFSLVGPRLDLLVADRLAVERLVEPSAVGVEWIVRDGLIAVVVHAAQPRSPEPAERGHGIRVGQHGGRFIQGSAAVGVWRGGRVGALVDRIGRGGLIAVLIHALSVASPAGYSANF
jgi:hypothetical protein